MEDGQSNDGQIRRSRATASPIRRPDRDGPSEAHQRHHDRNHEQPAPDHRRSTSLDQGHREPQAGDREHGARFRPDSEAEHQPAEEAGDRRAMVDDGQRDEPRDETEHDEVFEVDEATVIQDQGRGPDGDRRDHCRPAAQWSPEAERQEDERQDHHRDRREPRLDDARAEDREHGRESNCERQVDEIHVPVVGGRPPEQGEIACTHGVPALVRDGAAARRHTGRRVEVDRCDEEDPESEREGDGGQCRPMRPKAGLEPIDHGLPRPCRRHRPAATTAATAETTDLAACGRGHPHGKATIG